MNNLAKQALVLGLAGALTAAMAGCSYLLPTEEETLAPPLVATKDVTYVTEPVTRGDVIEEKRANGSFMSSKTQEVYFEASGGTLAKVNVTYGQEVKEGDVLLELNADDLQYQYDAAKIRYEMQKTTYRNTSGSAAKKMQKYSLDLAQLELDHLAAKLEKTKLVAPIGGKITYLAEMRVGDALEPYKSYISISDPTQLLLVVTGDEAYSFITDRDVKVKIKDQYYEGKVLQNPNDKPTTLIEKNDDKAYAIFDVYNVPEDMKTLGREAQVSMVSNSRIDVLTLPTNAVRDYNGRTYVQVLEEGKKIEKDVVVGLKTSTVCEIVSGLEEGEEVIIG